jgi:hypothetical protein
VAQLEIIVIQIHVIVTIALNHGGLSAQYHSDRKGTNALMCKIHDINLSIVTDGVAKHTADPRPLELGSLLSLKRPYSQLLPQI